MNIDVNKIAKAYATAEIIIDAPVQVVYQLIADINAWPNWQKNVVSARVEGEIAVGTEFNWKANGMPIKSKLHTVEINKEIGWTGSIAWISAIHNWFFTEIDEKTKVIVEESMSGFLSGFLKKSLEQGMMDNLAELKEAAEKQ